MSEPRVDTRFTIDMLVPGTDSILVKMVPPDAQSKGGIVIPDAARQETGVAEVLRVCPGEEDKIPFEPGDFVCYARGSGRTLQFCGNTEEYLLLHRGGDLGDEVIGWWPKGAVAEPMVTLEGCPNCGKGPF